MCFSHGTGRYIFGRLCVGKNSAIVLPVFIFCKTKKIFVILLK